MGSDLETRIRNVTAVLGPDQHRQDPSRHRAHARPRKRHDRPAAAPARARGLRQDRRARRRRQGRAHHRRGEDQAGARRATGCAPSRRCRATSTSTSSPSTRSSSPPIPSAATSSPTACCMRAAGPETLLLGAQTMREAISDLIPGANFISRPRLSKLTYAGQKKITRLPPRTAIVAFSAAEVYAIAELIRRQRGGAAVVLGALSPRTRNAQVALYQSGDVDYPRRDRRHRHGPQSRRRSRRVRGDAQVRRPQSSQPDAGRARARSPAAPAAT